MTPEQMTALVERHLKAEGAGDVEGAVAVYTEDIEHDVGAGRAAQCTAKTPRAASTGT